MNDKRLLRSFLLAPLVGPFLVWLLGAILPHAGEVTTVAGAIRGLFVILLFGAPLAYVAALLVGLPTIWWIRRTGRRSVAVCLAAGTVGAMLVVGLVGPSTVFFGQRRAIDFVVAGLIGAASGAVFWWLGIKEAPTTRSEEIAGSAR